MTDEQTIPVLPAFLHPPLETLYVPTSISLTMSQMRSALLELWELGINLQTNGFGIGADILKIIEEKGQEDEGS